MGEVGIRVVSALILTLVGVSALVLSPVSRTLFLIIILTLGAWEFARLVNQRLAGPRTAWLSASLVLILLLPRLSWPFPPEALSGFFFSAWLLATVFAFILTGFRALPIESMAAWISLQITGVLFLGVWGAGVFELFLPVAGWTAAQPFLLVVFCMTANDSGAYFTGRAWGRSKLAPSISSKKTWEGAWGGLASSVAIALVLGPWWLDMSWWASVVFGTVMAFTAVCGDLLMSVLKRYAGAKDSSRLIPGHGGILDRFDSVLLSAPVAVFFLNLVGVLR